MKQIKSLKIMIELAMEIYYGRRVKCSTDMAYKLVNLYNDFDIELKYEPNIDDNTYDLWK